MQRNGVLLFLEESVCNQAVVMLCLIRESEMTDLHDMTLQMNPAKSMIFTTLTMRLRSYRYIIFHCLNGYDFHLILCTVEIFGVFLADDDKIAAYMHCHMQ